MTCNGNNGWHRDIVWIACLPSSLEPGAPCQRQGSHPPHHTAHSAVAQLYGAALRENTWLHFDFFSIGFVLISIHKGVDEPHPASSLALRRLALSGNEQDSRHTPREETFFFFFSYCHRLCSRERKRLLTISRTSPFSPKRESPSSPQGITSRA